MRTTQCWRVKADLTMCYKILHGKDTGNSLLKTGKFPPTWRKIPFNSHSDKTQLKNPYPFDLGYFLANHNNVNMNINFHSNNGKQIMASRLAIGCQKQLDLNLSNNTSTVLSWLLYSVVIASESTTNITIPRSWMQYTNGFISQIKSAWTDKFVVWTECTLSISWWDRYIQCSLSMGDLSAVAKISFSYQLNVFLIKSNSDGNPQSPDAITSQVHIEWLVYTCKQME